MRYTALFCTIHFNVLQYSESVLHKLFREIIVVGCFLVSQYGDLVGRLVCDLVNIFVERF